MRLGFDPSLICKQEGKRMKGRLMALGAMALGASMLLSVPAEAGELAVGGPETVGIVYQQSPYITPLQGGTRPDSTSCRRLANGRIYCR